jgi:hypothetical protein
MEITFRGGRLAPDRSKPRLTLSNYLTGPEALKSVDWASQVSDWPMYLNDKIGDCTCAAVGHVIEAVTQYGEGKTEEVPDDLVLKTYEAVSGYDPKTGANDRGAVMQDVLSYWRKTGVGSHRIVAFAEVDHQRPSELNAALDLFGHLYIGINFPASAMDQFNRNQPWDVVPGAQIEGGHAIHGGKYDADTKTWHVTTWGRLQPMTQAFWDQYVEESWVALTPEWYSSGRSPEGFDKYALGEDFAKLTGEANPFPKPNPGPSPDPTPTEDPDAAFIQASKDYLQTLQKWLEGK